MKKTLIYTCIALLSFPSLTLASECSCFGKTRTRKDSRTINYIAQRKKSDTDAVTKWFEKTEKTSYPTPTQQKQETLVENNPRVALEDFITVYGSITGFAGMCLLIAIGLN